MTDQDASTPTSAPGWYPDPWKAAPLRYFDGIAWTQHTHGNTNTAAYPTAPAPMVLITPGTPKLGRAGMILVTIYMVANIGVTILTGTTLSSYYHDIFTRQAGDPVPSPPAEAVWVNLISFPTLFVGIIGLVLLIMWAYRNAQNAQALGIPAKLTPGWAIGGWFIPLANYVLPYFSISGALPEPMRRAALRWWLALIAPLLVTFPLSIAMFISFSTGNTTPLLIAGGIALLIGLAAAVLQVIWGYELTQEIQQAHTELAGGRSS